MSFRFRLAHHSALFLLALIASSFGRVLHVDSARTAEGDGLSWATAFRTMDAAVAASFEFDTLRIAKGTYTSSAPITQGVAFTLKAGMTLQGGYAAGGTERDGNRFVTVLSADQEGNDIAGDSAYSRQGDNFKHVLAYDAASSSPLRLTLDGISVAGGDAGDESGGGLKIGYGSLTLKDCRFYGNRARSGGAIVVTSYLDSSFMDGCRFYANEAAGTESSPRGDGGALAVNARTMAIFRTTFSDNRAFDGGAIHYRGTFLHLDGCSFQNQEAASEGGGIFFAGDSVRVERSIFRNQKANLADGGGIRFDGRKLILRNNLFDQCRAGQLGGGVRFRGEILDAAFNRFDANAASNGGGMLAYGLRMTVDSNQFVRNHSSVLGGGFSFGSSGSLTRCVFLENVAPMGGGSFGGANDTIRISASLFERNASDSGAGLAFDRGRLILDSTTFRGNAATRTAGGLLGAKYGPSLEISNSTFIGNSSAKASALFQETGNALKVFNTRFLQNQATQAGTLTAQFTPEGRIDRCLFQGNTADSGSAIYHYPGVVSNSIFTGNSARTLGTVVGNTYREGWEGPNQYFNLYYGNTAAQGTGGCFNCTGQIQGNIFWANSVPQLDSIRGRPVSGLFPANISRNILQGLATSANGNFSADPQFANAGLGDFSLRSSSPAIDAFGAPPAQAGSLDFAGNPRAYGPIDIGPMEYQGMPYAAPVLLSALNTLRLLPGHSLKLKLDSLDPGGNPLYVRFAGSLSALRFNILAADTDLTVEYQPVTQTLSVLPGASFLPGQVRFLTLKVSHPTRNDLFDQKRITLEMAAPGFEIKGFTMAQNDTGIFEGRLRVTGNAYPMVLGRGRIYLGKPAAVSLLAPGVDPWAYLPYLSGLTLEETMAPVSRGGLVDPGAYSLRFNGASAQVHLPGDVATGMSLAQWARTQSSYRSSGAITFNLPVSDGFEPNHRVSLSVKCAFNQPLTVLSIVENHPHAQVLRWQPFAEPLKSLTLRVEARGAGAAMPFTIVLTGDSLFSTGLRIDNLQDARKYRYRLIAVDRRNQGGESEIDATTPSADYTLSGRLSGAYVSSDVIPKIFIEKQAGLFWKPVVTLPVEQGAPWSYGAVQFGERYRITLRADRYFAEPAQRELIMGRADVAGLDFRLSAEPVVFKDSVQVRQRLGSGNLVISARTARLYAGEAPVRVRLRWEGGFPDRSLDSQDIEIRQYTEKPVGDGSAWWTLEIPRSDIETSILSRTRSFDRDVRYLGSEIITSAFSESVFRSGPFDYPRSDSPNHVQYAAQLYAKPDAPWVGEAVAHIRDITLPIAGGSFHPGLKAEVALTPVETGEAAQGVFAMKQIGAAVKSGSGSRAAVTLALPMDFRVANDILPRDSVLSLSAGLTLPLADHAPFLATMALGTGFWQGSLRVPAAGRYRPFLHLSRPALGSAAIRLSSPSQSKDWVIPIGKGDSGWVGVHDALFSPSALPTLETGVSDWQLSLVEGVSPWIDAMAMTQRTGFATAPAPSAALLQKAPMLEPGPSVVAGGFHLTPDRAYVAAVVLRDALGNVSDTVRVSLHTLDDTYAGTIALHQDTGNGALKITLPPSGQGDLTATRVKFTFNGKGYSLAVKVPVAPETPTVVSIPKSALPQELRGQTAFSQSPVYLAGEIVLERPWLAFLPQRTEIQVGTCGDCALCKAVTWSNLGSLASSASRFVCSQESNVLSFNSTVDRGIGFAWPDSNRIQYASQGYLIPAQPEWRLTQATAHALTLKSDNLDKGPGGESKRQLSGRMEITWKPGSKCEDSSHLEIPFGTRFQSQDGWVALAPGFAASQFMQVGLWRAKGTSRWGTYQGTRHQWLDGQPMSAGNRPGGFAPDIGDSVTHAELFSSSLGNLPRLSMAIRLDSAAASLDSSDGEQLQIWILPGLENGLTSRRFALGMNGFPLANGEVVMPLDGSAWMRGPKVTLAKGNHTVDLFMLEDGASLAGIALSKSDLAPTWTAESLPHWGEVGFDATAMIESLPSGSDITVKSRAVDRFGNASSWMENHFQTLSKDLPPALLTVTPLDSLYQGYEITTTPRFEVTLNGDYPDSLGLAVHFERVSGGLAQTMPAMDDSIIAKNHWLLSVTATDPLEAHPDDGQWINDENGYRLLVSPVNADRDTGDATRLLFGVRSDSASVPAQPAFVSRNFVYSPYLQLGWLNGLIIDDSTLVGDLAVGLSISNVELPGQRILLRGATVHVKRLTDSLGAPITDSLGNRYFEQITGVSGGRLDLELCPEAGECKAIKSMTLPLGRYMTEFRLDSLRFASTAGGLILEAGGLRVRDDRGAWARASGNALQSTAVPFTSDGFLDTVYIHQDEFHIGRLTQTAKGSPGFGLSACRAKLISTRTDHGPVHFARLEGACGACGPFLEFTVHDGATGDSAFSRRDALAYPVEMTAEGDAGYRMRFVGAARNRHLAAHPDTLGYGGLGFVFREYAFDSNGVAVEDFDVILPEKNFPDSLNGDNAHIRGFAGLRIDQPDTTRGYLRMHGNAGLASGSILDTLTLSGGQQLLPVASLELQVEAQTRLQALGGLLKLPVGPDGAFADPAPVDFAVDTFAIVQGNISKLRAQGTLNRHLGSGNTKGEDSGKRILLSADVATDWAGDGLHVQVSPHASDSLFCLTPAWFTTMGTSHGTCFNGLIQFDAEWKMTALEGAKQLPPNSDRTMTPENAGIGSFTIEGLHLRLQRDQARVVFENAQIDLLDLADGSAERSALGPNRPKNLFFTEDVTADAYGQLATLTAGLDVPKEFQSLKALPGFHDLSGRLFDLQPKRISLGLHDEAHSGGKFMQFKAKGDLVLGSLFEAVGMDGARIQVEDLTFSHHTANTTESANGFSLDSIKASLGSQSQRYEFPKSRRYVEFLTAGGELRVEHHKTPGPTTQVSLSDWTVGFTPEFPIADLRGLRLYVDTFQMDAQNGKILKLNGRGDYVPEKGELEFPGFKLTGVKMTLGSDDKGGYVQLHFDQVVVGDEPAKTPNTGGDCTQNGKIYFDGNFYFEVCVEFNHRIPIYPVNPATEADQQFYLAGGDGAGQPGLLKIKFSSAGNVEFKLSDFFVNSRDVLPVIDQRLHSQVEASVKFDAVLGRFSVESFSVTERVDKPLVDQAPFKVSLEELKIGYESSTYRRFFFNVAPRASLTAGSDCLLKLTGQAGIDINVETAPNADFLWNIKGGGTCSIEGLEMTLEDFSVSDTKVGFGAASLSIDDAWKRASGFFDKKDVRVKTPAEKPPVGLPPITLGAYFTNWYLERAPGTANWALNPGSIVPTFETRIKFDILGQTIVTTADFTHILRDKPEMVFRDVQVKLGDNLGGAEIPTGWELRLNGTAPYVHARVGMPKSVTLAIPSLNIGGVKLAELLLEFGVQDGNAASPWYARGRAGLSLGGLLNQAQVELELEKPSDINATGLKSARVTLKLSEGARIPLGTTGFFVTGFTGAIYDGDAIPAAAIACDIVKLPAGLKMEAAVFIEYEDPRIANGHLGFWMQLTHLNLGLNGELVMLEGVADADACVALYQGGSALHGKFTVTAEMGLAMRGKFVVDLWSDGSGSNFTSSATAEVGLKRGSLYKSRWLKIPRTTYWFGGVSTKLGRFDNGANGFTGGVRFLSKNWGVGVIGGDFVVGNVGKYRLKQPPLAGAQGGGAAGGAPLRKSAAMAAVSDDVPALTYLPLGLKLEGDEVLAITAAVDSGGGLPDADNPELNSHNSWPSDALKILTLQGGSYVYDHAGDHYLDPENGTPGGTADASENTLSRVWQNPESGAVTDSVALAVPIMPLNRDREKYEYQIFAGLRPPEARLYGQVASDAAGPYVVISGTVAHFQKDARSLERHKDDNTLETLFKLRHELELGIAFLHGAHEKDSFQTANELGVNAQTIRPSDAEGAGGASRWDQVPGVSYVVTSRTLTLNQVKIRPKVRLLGEYVFTVGVNTRDFVLVKAADAGNSDAVRTVLPDAKADSAYVSGPPSVLLTDRSATPQPVILTVDSLPENLDIATLSVTSGHLSAAPWADSAAGNETRTLYMRWPHPKAFGPVGYHITVQPKSCAPSCAVWRVKHYTVGPTDHFSLSFPNPQDLVRADSLQAVEASRSAATREDGTALVRGQAWADSLAWYNEGEYTVTLTPRRARWNATAKQFDALDASGRTLTGTVNLGVSAAASPALLSLRLPPGDAQHNGLPVYRVPRNEAGEISLGLRAEGTGTSGVTPVPLEAYARITETPTATPVSGYPMIGPKNAYPTLSAETDSTVTTLKVRVKAKEQRQTCRQAHAYRCPKGVCRTDEILLKGPCPDGPDALVNEATPNGLYRVDFFALQAQARADAGAAPAATVRDSFYVEVTPARPVLQKVEPEFLRLDQFDTLRITAGHLDTAAARAGEYTLAIFDSAGNVVRNSIPVNVDWGAFARINGPSLNLRASQQLFVEIWHEGERSKRLPIDGVQFPSDISCSEKDFLLRVDRNNAMDYLGIYPKYVGINSSIQNLGDEMVLRVSQVSDLADSSYQIAFIKPTTAESLFVPHYLFDREGIHFSVPNSLIPGKYTVSVINRTQSSQCYLKGASTVIIIYQKEIPQFTRSGDSLCLSNYSIYRKYRFFRPKDALKWFRLSNTQRCIEQSGADKVLLVSTDIDGNNIDTTYIPVSSSNPLNLVTQNGQVIGDTLDVGKAHGPFILKNPATPNTGSVEQRAVAIIPCYQINSQAPICGDGPVRITPSTRGILAIWEEYRPFDGSAYWKGPIRYIILIGPAITPFAGQFYRFAADLVPTVGPLPQLLLPSDPGLGLAQSGWMDRDHLQPLNTLGEGVPLQNKWLALDSLPNRGLALGLLADTVRVSVAAPWDTSIQGVGVLIPGRLGQARRMAIGEAFSAPIGDFLAPTGTDFTWQTWLRLPLAQSGLLLDFNPTQGTAFSLSVQPEGALRLSVASQIHQSLAGVIEPDSWQHIAVTVKKQEESWRWQVLVNGMVVISHRFDLVHPYPMESGILTLLAADGEALDYELQRLRPQSVSESALSLVYRAERNRRDALIANGTSPEIRVQRGAVEGDAWRSDNTRYSLTQIDEELQEGELLTLPNASLSGPSGDYSVLVSGTGTLHALLGEAANPSQAWLSAFAPALGGAGLTDKVTGGETALRHYSAKVTQGFTVRIPKSTPADDLPAFIYKVDPVIFPLRVKVSGARMTYPLSESVLLYPDREDTLGSIPDAWKQSVLLSLPFAERADTSDSDFRLSLKDRAMVRLVVPTSAVEAGAWFTRAPWRKEGAVTLAGLARTVFTTNFTPGDPILPPLAYGVGGVPEAQMLVLVSRSERTCLISEVNAPWGRPECSPIGQGASLYLDGSPKIASIPKFLQGAQAVVSYQKPTVTEACLTLTQAAEIVVGLPESATLPRALQEVDERFGAFMPLYTTLQSDAGIQYRLYRRPAQSGRTCLDFSLVAFPAPLILALPLEGKADSLATHLDIGTKPYLDRTDIRVVAVPEALKGAVVLPVLQIPVRCDTLSLAYPGPTEAFVAFEPVGTLAFENYLLAQGWLPLTDSLVLSGKSPYRVYHLFVPHGGVQVPGRGCFEAPVGSSQWVVSVRPMPGVALGLQAEDVHVTLMGGTRRAASASFEVSDLDVQLTWPQEARNAHYKMSLKAKASAIKPQGRDTLQVWSPYLDTLVTSPTGEPVRIRKSALLPDLVPLWVDADSIAVDARTLEVSGELRVQVRNQSEVAAYRRFAIVAYQDVNGDYQYEEGVDSLLSRAIVMGLSANEEATYLLNLAGQAAYPEKTFMALVDADRFLPETDKANNQAQSVSVCEKSRQQAAHPVAVDSTWVHSHTGAKAATFFAREAQGVSIAFIHEDSVRLQSPEGTSLLPSFPAPGEDTLAVRDVTGDAGPEILLPWGVLNMEGQLALDARTCTDALAADSLSFDFDGDGTLDSLSCSGGVVSIHGGKDGSLLATLGGSEPNLPHSLTDIEQSSESQVCRELSISYPRITPVNATTMRVVVRIANAGEDTQPQGLAWQLRAWSHGVWEPIGIPQTVGSLQAGQYVDVTQELVLTDLPSRLQAEVVGGDTVREINGDNNQVEWTWPSNP